MISTDEVKKLIESGIEEVFASECAFAALKRDGSLVTWGDPERGGDSSHVKGKLQPRVPEVLASSSDFGALAEERSAVTLEGPKGEGSCNDVDNDLEQRAGKEEFTNNCVIAAFGKDLSPVNWAAVSSWICACLVLSMFVFTAPFVLNAVFSK